MRVFASLCIPPPKKKPSQLFQMQPGWPQSEPGTCFPRGAWLLQKGGAVLWLGGRVAGAGEPVWGLAFDAGNLWNEGMGQGSHQPCWSVCLRQVHITQEGQGLLQGAY